ncbi:MAG TPA: TetR/AcrR family transcriptional regulator [Oxalicibacterium sp.]|jgi:TetR/AcrR family transcriptional repressor of nem operon|nr:TetR/AcrR family transcriptional regulator [Oxalicibacterium sp.]
MPRVSKEQADRNRKTIESAAAMLFREKGINGVSVADLMSAAGLTHGGFYGHFSSKDELAATACSLAFEQSVQRWAKRIESQPDDGTARAALIDGYLSARTLKDIGNACPAMTLAADVAREPADKPVRAAYAAGVTELIEILASVASSADPAQRRQQALVQISTMVGAMSLARAMQGDELADDILAACRSALLHDADPAATQTFR